MRVLVTGGAGFIGSHLVDRLLAEDHQVSVLDDLSSGHPEQVAPQATIHPLDVASPWVARLVARERPACVVHLAAQIDLRSSVRDPIADARVNVMGTVQLLTAAAMAGVRRVVFASSGGTVYGETDQLPTQERHPLRPASPYGAAKMAGEGYLAAFAGSFGLETVILRLANIYGPRQDPHGEAGVVAIFTERLLAGEFPLINGDGLQTRDYVFIADAVDAFARALTGPTGTYNVGTGVETNVLEICSGLRRAIGGLPGREMPPEPQHGPAKAGEQLRSALDASLARDRLGWHPQTSLAEGLSRTVEHFAAAGGDYL